MSGSTGCSSATSRACQVGLRRWPGRSSRSSMTTIEANRARWRTPPIGRRAQLRRQPARPLVRIAVGACALSLQHPGVQCGGSLIGRHDDARTVGGGAADDVEPVGGRRASNDTRTGLCRTMSRLDRRDRRRRSSGVDLAVGGHRAQGSRSLRTADQRPLHCSATHRARETISAVGPYEETFRTGSRSMPAGGATSIPTTHPATGGREDRPGRSSPPVSVGRECRREPSSRRLC